MKKIKIAPAANVVTAAQLKGKFERLAANVGDNGLTPNFSYALIPGAYGIKAGVNPQNKQTVDYPTVKAVKIGIKSTKVSGLSELSINSLKRTINIEDSSIDVVDFSLVIPNCAELNALQLLESLPEDKIYAIVPNGALVGTTNFDSTLRPRQVYKVLELTDTAKVTEILAVTKTAGITE